jgi:type I restriction enzyme, S subunit
MQKGAFTFIKIIDFTQLVNWSSYALLGKNLIYTQKYPFVRIGDLLKRNKEAVKIQDETSYKRATIRINGQGISLRDTVLGKVIGTKNQFIIHAGQFLLSKIDARNGAFGVVPVDLEGGIITGNFWTFDVDYSRINPHYLTLLTGTKEFQKLSQSASVGTTNRNYLQEKQFLDFLIPLPTIQEQQKILNNYNLKIQQVEELKIKSTKFENEINNFLLTELGIIKQVGFELKNGLNFIEFVNLTKWALTHLYKDNQNIFEKSKYITMKFKDLLLFFEGGKTPSKSRNDFWNGEIFWTSPKDFKGRSIIEKSEDKITQLAVDETGIRVFPKGVFLSVFRSGILQHSFPTAITEIETAINQDLKAYSLKEDLIDKYYYLHFVHVFKKQILSNCSKKSVTVESINTEDFMELQIPLPPLTIQKKISERINTWVSEKNILEKKANEIKIQSHQEFENEIFQLP